MKMPRSDEDIPDLVHLFLVNSDLIFKMPELEPRITQASAAIFSAPPCSWGVRFIQKVGWNFQKTPGAPLDQNGCHFLFFIMRSASCLTRQKRYSIRFEKGKQVVLRLRDPSFFSVLHFIAINKPQAKCRQEEKQPCDTKNLK